ncbi:MULTISPECIES: FecR domain-containing protein [Olivibacter]|uniref:FecR domain-containing protein n=1 Tax=Olivibacter jilunii TaxID=985016 RepID=A0ABW6AXS0_9SPHI
MKDELLIKFLLKEASPEEDQDVQAWLAEDQANRKKFEQFKLIWDTSKQLALQQPMDEDIAWKRFQLLRDQRFERPPEDVDEGDSIPHLQEYQGKGTGWLRVAASILAVMGLMTGIYLYIIAPKHPYLHSIEVTANETPLTDTLPDGTVVTLNSHAKLSYTEDLFNGQRKVHMSGEAFFDVASDKKRPFNVAVKDLTINVLGTSFNVKSNRKLTEVIVETGAVQVSREDVIIKLKPDEKAIAMVEQKGLKQEKQHDKLYDYYRSRMFKLDGTPLWRFVEVLNEVYQVRIVPENIATGNLPITTTFDNDSLPGILHTLCKTLRLEMEKNGKTIILKKETL